MIYEVVCTQSYLDVGLLVEKNSKSEPKRVLARTYNGEERQYGGVESQAWVNTGVFLSKDEWNNISYKKDTDDILKELGIEKKINSKEVSKEVGNMTTDEMAIALVKLYAEYMCANDGNHNEDYAEAVAVAIRMLSD